MKWFPIVGIFLISLSIFLMGCTSKQKNQEVITIGVVIPLTGPGSIYGQNTQRGIDLAVQEINAAGGINGLPLKVIYEDDETNPTKSVSAVKKLIDVNGVYFIVGGMWDFLANAVIPIIDQAGVLLVSPAVLPDTVKEESPYFFTFIPPTSFHQENFEKWINQLPGKRVGALVTQNSWGLAHLETFKKAVKATGATLVVERKLLNTDDNDFMTELALFKEERLDGIFININFKDSENFLRKRVELGIVSQILAHENLKIAIISGSIPSTQAEGIFTFQFSEPPQVFTNKFKNTYGQPPIYVGDIAYDIIYALKQAIEAKGEDSVAIREAFHEIDFTGASGRIYFSENNFPANKHSVLEKVTNGKFITVSPTS